MPKRKHPLGYPCNLIDDVVESEFEYIVTDDQRAGLDKALSTLTDREQSVIKQLYFEDKTLKEVGNSIGVTGSRVQQIKSKALRKLRHKSRLNLIIKGLSVVEAENEVNKLKAELALIRQELMKEKERLLTEGLTEEQLRCSELYFLDVVELNLSVRTYNSLKRGGIDTIGEIISAVQAAAANYKQNPMEFFIGSFRNMGRISAFEVIYKLWNVYGIDLNLLAREAMVDESK